LITFIAALSSSIVIEESAQEFHSPFHLLCLEILNLLFILNKHFDFELDPASVSEALTDGLCRFCNSGEILRNRLNRLMFVNF